MAYRMVFESILWRAPSMRQAFSVSIFETVSCWFKNYSKTKWSTKMFLYSPWVRWQGTLGGQERRKLFSTAKLSRALSHACQRKLTGFLLKFVNMDQAINKRKTNELFAIRKIKWLRFWSMKTPFLYLPEYTGRRSIYTKKRKESLIPQKIQCTNNKCIILQLLLLLLLLLLPLLNLLDVSPCHDIMNKILWLKYAV